MRPKNLSFGEVIRSKQQRSPQLQVKNRATRLADLVRQWENDPENNYTLYLGHNQYPQRNQFSTSRMLNSSNRTNETHFDNWIENQRNPYMVEIDNSQGFRGNKASQASNRINFNSKGHQSSKSPKTMGELVRKNKQVLHIENSSQYANSVGNVQMIKSKTCQNNEKKNNPVKQPTYRRELMTNHIQFEEPPMPKEISNKNKYVSSKNYESNQASKKQMKFKSLLDNKKKEQSIEQLIEHTKNNITNQIAQLAQKYADHDEEEYREPSFQQVSRNQDREQQEDQLLIGDSDKKPLSNDQPLFSESYEEKARKAEELDRLRKEEAKNRINDLMKNYKPLRKNDEIFKIPEMKFPEREQRQEIFQDNYQVGYSFASNQPQELKKYQNYQSSRQENLYENTYQEQQGQKPIKLESSEQFQFKQKYVNNEVNEMPTFQNVFERKSMKQEIRESVRQQEGLANENKPNSSFQTKLITTSKEEQPKIVPVQLPTNNFSRHQFSRKNSTEQFTKIEVVSKQVKFSQPEASQLKVEPEPAQNKSFTQQFGKFPHQKIKIVSSSKNYNFNNSSKSHKSGSAKSSNEKTPAVGVTKEVKTQPFVPVVQTPAQNQKPKQIFEAKETAKSKQKCSPFKTIKQVKNSIVNPSRQPEVSQTISVQNYEVNTVKLQPPMKETNKQPLSKVKTIELEFQTQEPKYSTTYTEPTYGTKKAALNFQTSPYYTSEYMRTTPISYALPTHIEESNAPSYSVKTLKNSKQNVNEYQLPTYAPKPFSSPKTFDYAPKYDSKYTSSITSSYQVCEKFDSILNLTKKEFPDNKQTVTKPQESTSNPTSQPTGKRSFLTELDIKQSINMQEVGKKTLGFTNIQKPTTKQKVEVFATQKSSGLDNVIKKSLKQSINLQSSGQFKFDF